MDFIRNIWYAAMWAQDLPEIEMTSVTVIGEPLVLFRNGAGSPVALLDRCPHRFAPLHLGTVCADRERIQCGYHGLQFDTSGRCVHSPHSDRIPAAAKVKAFPVIERHSLIWVWMGDGEPRPSLIPDYSAFDEGNDNQVSRRETIELSVNYQLMTDNLLDLSHVSFLHDGILGHSGMARGHIDVQQNDRTLHVRRSTLNVAPPGLFDLMFQRDGKPVDVWADMRWNAPACMLNDAGVCPPGESRENGVHMLGAHILTPISEFKTYYHFAAVRFDGAIKRTAADEREVMEKLASLRRHAFQDQDEPMVLAQQEVQRAAGGLDVLQPVLLNIDAGPVRARRMLSDFKTKWDAYPINSV
jgi:phenylpropionate dioxygenase-like ring-hydroxylating dioxygenase large terminal subunit